MARPVFLSMAGKADTQFAKRVKDLLPDPMVYFYQRTGEEGVAFRTEIEREIQGCRLFVVFWSDDYLASDHSKWELALFKKLVQAGEDKDLLIVPTRRKHPNLQGKWKNPLTSLDEHTLGRWRLERAVYQGGDAERVAENIRRKLAKANLLDRALVSRPVLLSDIKIALSLPNYQTPHLVFISGLEGDGRRTALRQYMTSAHVNLTPRYVSLDTTEGPEDLFLKLHNTSTPQQRAEALQSAREQGNIGKAIRTRLFEVAESKSYYVIVLSRFTASDTGLLPFWLADVFGSLRPGNAPLVFLVVPGPISDAQKAHYSFAARLRIPGLDETEMAELVYKLAQEDRDPKRWTDQARAVVARVSGSSPSLCHAIMYSMSTEPTLQFLEKIAHHEANVFSANISALAGHLVRQFKDRPSDLLALRIIERLGLTSQQTLDEIFALHENLQPYDLYQLREYGLVERLSDDIYRIPPLLQRRLGDALWAASGREELDKSLLAFASKMLADGDEYGAVYASNKVAAQLRTSTAIPQELQLYLTTATLFKAGLDRYIRNEFSLAHSILQRAMRRLVEGDVVDPLTQIELARYYGLAAARLERFAEVKLACDFLRGSSVQARAPQAAAMVSFLEGFQARIAGDHRAAVTSFEQAKDRLSGVRYAERQRGAILTELSRSYLRVDPPRYDKAVAIAQQAYDQVRVVHNLSGLIRARLARLEGEYFADDARFHGEVGEINVLLDVLTEMCERSGQDFHLVRRADLERLLAFKRKAMGEDAIRDLSRAIALADAALALRNMSQTVAQGWYLRVFDERIDHAEYLLKATEGVLKSADHSEPMNVRDALAVNVLVTARTNPQAAKATLRRFDKYVSMGLRSHLMKVISEKGHLGDSPESYSRFDRV